MLDPDEGVAPDGTIVTGVGRARVPVPFEPVVAAVVDALGGVDGVSAYLYGSVATGRARPGESDVDLLTVGLDRPAAQRLGRELSARFRDVCRSVELAPVGPEDLVGDSDEAYGNRVFLRHYAVHLTGPDVAAGLPAYPADGRAARGFNGDVARHAERWRLALDAGEDARRLGRRAARKTLLAVAWSDGRTAAEEAPEVRAALDTTVAEVVGTFATLVGLWE